MPSGWTGAPSGSTGARSIDLPDGAMIALEEGAFAVRGDALLHWTPSGYDARQASAARHDGRRADAAGDPRGAEGRLSPQWHPSAET